MSEYPLEQADQSKHRITFAAGKKRLDSVAGEVVDADEVTVQANDHDGEKQEITVKAGEFYETDDSTLAANVAEKLQYAVGAGNVSIVTTHTDPALQPDQDVEALAGRSGPAAGQKAEKTTASKAASSK